MRGHGATARPGYIDELTLLHNQRWLDTVFPRLISRYRMGDKKFAVVAFAVDKLEEITKQHGVGAAMRVLEKIGPWLLDQTRPTDILAIDKNRHFLAFLPDCDLDAARQLARRLKTAIKSAAITLPSGRNALCNDRYLCPRDCRTRSRNERNWLARPGRCPD